VIPATRYPVERFTLHNGLRVVVSPDRSAPVIGVAVVYDVGIRSEPPGRTGFAHLFELWSGRCSWRPTGCAGPG
jgi:zinc protease